MMKQQKKELKKDSKKSNKIAKKSNDRKFGSKNDQIDKNNNPKQRISGIKPKQFKVQHIQDPRLMSDLS